MASGLHLHDKKKDEKVIEIHNSKLSESFHVEGKLYITFYHCCSQRAVHSRPSQQDHCINIQNRVSPSDRRNY